MWTALGLVRYHVSFVMRPATREVQIPGITPEPNGAWMKQMARNLTAGLDGFLNGCRYLHYHQERNHQGLENKLIRPEFRPLPKEGTIKCRKRLGGMWRCYYREAA